MIPESMAGMVNSIAKSPPGIRKLMIRRALEKIAPKDKADLWLQVKDLDVAVMAEMPPESWPATIPEALRVAILDMLTQVKTILEKECGA